MNIDYLIRRVLGKATCRLGAGARLFSTARIVNAKGDTESISIGSHSIIKGELMTFGHGGEVRIGEWCYVGENSHIWSAASIHIANRVLVSHSVNIFDNLTHPLNSAQRHEQIRSIFSVGHPRQLALDERPVKIEDDVWVGAGAFVMRGVTLKRGAVIAAGAVVTKDVPAYTVVAGNPAVIVRELGTNER